MMWILQFADYICMLATPRMDLVVGRLRGALSCGNGVRADRLRARFSLQQTVLARITALFLLLRLLSRARVLHLLLYTMLAHAAWQDVSSVQGARAAVVG